ncbi:hypothetical protein D3C87_324480 [compost metagenome]
MFCTQAETLTSRKDHVCTWCGEKILKGEEYITWKTVDDSWFTSKVHKECSDAMLKEAAEWGDVEYMPFENERPKNEVLRLPI